MFVAQNQDDYYMLNHALNDSEGQVLRKGGVLILGFEADGDLSLSPL